MDQPQGYYGIEDSSEVGVRGATGWDVNEAFVGRARAEQKKQVDEFRARKQQVAQGPAQEDQSLEGTIYKGGQWKGPNGGVPPGQRDPSDPEPAPMTPSENAGPGVAGGGTALAPNSGIFFNDGSDGDFRGRVENDFDVAIAQAAALGDPQGSRNVRLFFNTAVTGGTGGGAGSHAVDLAAAKGRISLRIDLPTDGEVYYFAKLGGADGVAFDADEKGKGLLHGALAILLAAGAAFLLRFRAKSS